MSAAATAAGYLYASGRLRGRNGRDSEPHEDNEHHRDNQRHYGDERPREARKPPVKVAVYQPQEPAPQAAPAAPKKMPKIEYRTRRWRPE